MKTNSRRVSKLLAFFLIAALTVAGFQLAFVQTATAEESGNIGTSYYYRELNNSELARKFYGAMSKMAEDGTAKKGHVELDLIGEGVVTPSDVAAYAASKSPNPTLAVAFGAARDAFYMDHPELFYFDVYKLYLTVGMKDGKYVAYMDTGRNKDFYVDNTVSNEAEVNAAVAEYDRKLNELVSAAKAESADKLKQIEFVNKYIAENTTYDYGAYDNKYGGVDYDGYVNTAYGALVNGKAMCEGYSTAFKAVMDKLDIPCTLVIGSALGKESVDSATGKVYPAGLGPHMWNAVQVDGMWYGVDVTWNSSSLNVKKYFLVGEDFLSVDHFQNREISSSGFKLIYPALRPLNYGVNEDGNGFSFKEQGTAKVKYSDGAREKEFGYDGEIGSYEAGLTLGISYEGKDFLQLEAEGKYFAERFYYEDGEGNGMWTVWLNMNIHTEYGTYDGYTVNYYGSNVYRIQYAVFDCKPDVDEYMYSESTANSHMIAASVPYTSEAGGKFMPAPYAIKRTPYVTGNIEDFVPTQITFVYDDKLVPADGSDLTADFVPDIEIISRHGDAKDNCTITDVKYDYATSTLSFVFNPSQQYIHNCETYNFAPTNLVGEKSGKKPQPAGDLTFKREEVVCPKVFNDSRLFIKAFGYPTFVDAEDMSLTEFKDGDGKPVVGNLRSQLMLVVNDPGKAESDNMMDELLADDGIGVNKEDIVSSATYKIDLQMCGKVQNVPRGSYMQIGFGFPQGYGPQDKGVTFTVYHYKTDSAGKIIGVEEVPCVVTEYGLIATVDSFSPFMVCAEKNKTVVGESIYAHVDGVGGKLNKSTIETLKPGASIPYVVTPDAGYKVESILLNGKDITSRIDRSGGELRIDYADLGGEGAVYAGSNELKVTFISERVDTFYAQNGVTVIRPNLVVTDADMIEAYAHEIKTSSAKKSNVGIIVAIVVGVVVVLAGAGVAVYFVMRKKNGGDGNKGGKKATAKKSSAAKSSQKATAKSGADTRTATATATANNAGANARPSGAATTARPANQTARPSGATAATRPSGQTASTRPSGTTAATRPASTAARPSATTRPASTAARPSATTRPSATASRPSGATRPSATDAARPAGSTTRPSQSTPPRRSDQNK